MFFNLINISIATVCLIHLALAVIFFRNWQNKINRWFSFLILSLIGWCVTMMFYRYHPTREGTIFWAILLYESAIFIPFTFLRFSLIFPENDEARKIKWFFKLLIFLPVLVLVFITAIPGQIIKDVIIQPGVEKILIFGSCYYFYGIYITLYFTLAFVILFWKYLRTKEMEKLQIKFVLLGALPSALFGCFTNLILPTFGIFRFNWLGQIATLILVIFIFYAVVKHHLMNIRVIATELFAGLLVLIVLFNVFLPLVFQQWIIRLILFAMVLVFSVLLIRGVLKMERMNEHLKKLLELKSEFLDIASHQLRTPVSVINGVISMLKEGSIREQDNKEKYEKFVDNVYQKGKKLEQIIEDILSASEMDSEDFKINENLKKPTQIEDIIQNVINELKPRAEQKNLELSFEKPTNPLPKLFVMPTGVEQAIFNLVDNAIIYTPSGFVKVKVRQENNQIVIDVSDSGIGIPKEDISKLFDKFVRADNAVNAYPDGSGLGLFIVKRMIQAHNGKASVRSQEGKGSTFTIELPIN